MKKYKKYLTTGVLAAAMVTSTLAIPTTHISAYAAPQDSDIKVGDVVTVKKVPSNWKIGTELSLPKATASVLGGSSSGTTVSVEIVAPNGRKVDESKINSSGDDYKFTPDRVGRYTVTYTATNSSGVTTTTESYSILVSADTYTMSFNQNDTVILPSYIDTMASRFDNNTIPNVVLPNPDVYNEDGVLVFTNGAYNTELDSNEDISEDLKEFYKKCAIKIVVNTENHTYSSQDGTLIKNDDTGYYSFAPEEGTNVISYTFYNTETSVSLQTQTKTIIGSNSYDHTKISIGYTVPNAPTTASLKDKTYLPLASAYNKSDANSTINVYTDIKVEYRDGSSLTPVEVFEDDEGFYFIPTVEEGSYKITYNVTDYYGNKGPEHSYTIENVKDTVAPTLYIVKGYDYASIANATVDLHEAKYLVPNKVGRNKGTITFPAIYAEDSVVDFEYMTFYRTITSTLLDSSINLQSDTYHPYTGDEEGKTSYTSAEKATREVNLDITDSSKFPAGDYTITYRVSDGSGYSSSWSTTFTISEELVDNSAPVVTYKENFPTIASVDQTIKFAKPTIEDDTSKVVDARYYVEFDGIDKAYEIGEDEEDSTYLSFDMSTKLEGQANQTLYELALANNSSFKVTTYVQDAYGNQQSYSRTINVNNTNDSQAPVITQKTGTSITNTYEQYSTVQVDGVKFKDNDKNLTIVVTVRDSQGNKVTGYRPLGAVTKEQSGSDYIFTHPGISFTANKAESYTVTYTAIDAGNNSASVTVVLPALTDKEAPKITGVVNNKTYTMELGTRLDLGLATVIDNKDQDLVASVTCLENPAYVNESVFTPLETNLDGYTIVYTAQDNEGNVAEEVRIKVIVQDTTKPILVVNNGNGYESERKEFTLVSNAADYDKIYIPDFASYDDDHNFGVGSGALNIGTTDSVEVAGPDGKTYTVDNIVEKYKLNYDEDRGEYYFIPTVKGTYTVTYSATDFSGNSAENQIIKIYVGDTVKPTVGYNGSLPTKIKVGGKLVLNIKNITITDNIEPEEGSEFTYNTITLNDASGNAVSYTESGEDKEIRTYVFDTAGTYYLTITAKDAAGNIGEYPLEITVTSGTSGTTYTNEVTGVVLIVVSLVILGGVIIYFAKGKSKTKKEKKSK